uniref:Osteoclast-stimulating factor 1 n=1 Tax=Hippocampus comes TaxID=109280 RepID=A0A3Q2XZV5_HIPCM
MVVVEFDYEALHEDELTLRKGDLIKNVCCIQEDGWMEGDLNGKRGLFPDNFVKVRAGEKTLSYFFAESESHLRLDKIDPVGGAGLAQQSRKLKKRQCKVLFEYQPQNEDELELKVGDILEITEEVEEGWWSGVINGKSGLFPSNFVKEVDVAKEDGDSNGTTPEEAVTPSSPQPASGNGAIVQPKKIQGIGFGDIFKEGSVKSKPLPSLPSAAKPAFANVTEMQRGDGESNSKAKDFCRVTFALEATNEDELTLREDDIISIISKDTGEPGWWRGEVGGKEGVFPDNFVVMLSESEKEVRSHSKLVQSNLSFRPSKKWFHETRSVSKCVCSISVDKPVPDPKPHKPAAPLPPKKPVPPPGKGKPGNLPPKRPDKPLTPSPNLKWVQNTTFSPSFASDLVGVCLTFSTALMSFDEVSPNSEKLSHPTANRPKITGRRLPAQFGGGHSVINSKVLKLNIMHPLAPILPPQHSAHNLSPPSHKHSVEAKPGPAAAASSSESGFQGREDPKSQLEALRSQMKDLLLSVELFKAQQM